MLKNKTLLLYASSVFIVAEIALGFSLQLAQGDVRRMLSYASVMLACLFFLLFFERTGSYIFTQIGLLCTVCADYFLVLSVERQQLPAMLFFSVTQLMYFARLYFADESRKRRTCHLFCRFFASTVAILATLIVLRESIDAVAIVSMFYYANLLINIVFAFLMGKRMRIFAIGLLLFVLCDTLIGLSCLDAYMTIPADSVIYWMIHPGFDLAWAFYVPSQTLLALSLLPMWPKK